jgi:predicted DCC family thiol-disulfide oxidoreductase YuxK
MEQTGPIILFDGVCNLCNASVQWVIQRDKKAQFRFASLQSEIGQRLLALHHLDKKGLDSVVLIADQQAYYYADAPLEIAIRLGGFWGLAVIFKVVPRTLRDSVYRWIARNRYRWFGKQEACWLPRPEWRARFLG